MTTTRPSEGTPTTPGPGGRVRAPRRPRPRRGRAFVTVLAIAGVVFGALQVLRYRDSRRVVLDFAREGAPPPPLELTVFPQQLAFAAPSPPPPLGTARVDGDSIALASDLVPDHAVVRYRGEGVGTGFVSVRLGERRAPIRLRPAARLVGRVGEPVSFWAWGWRCAGLRPVGGAEVIVMGGGEHGIDLATGVTDAEGRFAIDGIDAQLDGLGVRVRARGFALAHAAFERASDGSLGELAVGLERARTIAGVVTAPQGIRPADLRVLARGLPGVQATPEPDGMFLLDHVPRAMYPRLLLVGLGATWTHLPVRTSDEALLQIEVVPAAVVRGRVLDAASLQPLAGAIVWCGEQESVRADDDGRYELPQQVPGTVELRAQWDFVDTRRRRKPWLGRTRVELVAGQHHDGVDILVTAH